MKLLRKIALATGILATITISAQSRMNHMVKFRVSGGISLGKQSVANIGGELTYQHLIGQGFGIGLVSGYHHYFGKNNELTNPKVMLNNNDFGLIPVALLLRAYPQKLGFYAGADVGYGFLVGEKNVTTRYSIQRPKGGIYIKPEIGWHNDDWNVYAYYSKVFTPKNEGTVHTQKYDVSSIGLGVSYNLSFGR